MRLGLSSSFVLITLTVASVGGTYLACPGCVDRTRGNMACEWQDDSVFPIDVNNARHRQHLIMDAQLAEELAVRYADAEHPHRFGAESFRAHADNVQAQVTCAVRLTAAIESNHAVTVAQVAVARETRNPVFDSLVVLSFLPLFGFAAGRVCRLLRNALFADTRSVRLTALALTSVSVSGLGVVSFSLWWTLMEGMRVGNPEGHMGLRAASLNYWSHLYVVALLVAGMLLVWIVAAASARKHAAGLA